MIACLGETTGLQTLTRILELMKSTMEGTEILLNKPRINSKTVDLDALLKLPADTFGYHYRKFLDDNVNSHSVSPFRILKKHFILIVLNL